MTNGIRRTALLYEDVDSYVNELLQKARNNQAPSWLDACLDVDAHNYTNLYTYSTVLRAIIRRSMKLDAQEARHNSK
jgi:DNA replication initiation complex subunit (GINS family)